MNGKLLVLCDELPGEHKGFCVKDSRYFKIPYIDPMEDSDRIFMCWDSVVPEDRAFIEALKYYARFTEMPEPDFILKQRGATDPATGTLKTSVQEESYYGLYEVMLERLRRIQAEGKDVMGEALDMSVQYPFEANSRFFMDFSKLLNNKGFIRILPTYSKNSESNITNYRAQLLAAWELQNRFLDEKSAAKVLSPMEYSDFNEVLSRSRDELLEIYSLPIWGEVPSDDDIKRS